MPVILSDETWVRIENMLKDYEAGILYLIPGSGLKVEEEITPLAHCPGRRIAVDLTGSNVPFPTRPINVCVDGSPELINFLVKL